jgi:integrase
MKNVPYSANRTVEVLSKFFSWCETNGYREKGSNPTNGLQAYKEEKRLKFMGKEELEALGNGFAKLEAQRAIDPAIAAALKVLLFTGARCGEILTLKWAYLNLETGIASLPDFKTGAKVLHFPPQALLILEALPRVNEYCFPGRYGKGHIVNVKDTWKRVLAASGLEGWRIHDLRHAFASIAVSSGKSLPIIGKILGHTQTATTSRYAHLSDNPVASAVAETAAQIQKALSGGKILPFKKAVNFDE